MNRIAYIILPVIFFLVCLGCKTDPSEKQVEEIITPEVSVGNTSYLDSLISLDSKNSELYYDRALKNFNQGIYPASLSDIFSAISLDSSIAKYYYLGGDLFLKMNEGNKAIQLMSKGISILPEDQTLYLRAVEYNYLMGNHKAALNFANDLLVINKFNAEAYFFKGMIFKELGNIDKAISSFQTCVEQDPTFYNAFMQLGVILSEKKDDLSLSYLKNALTINENSREAIYAIGYHFQRTNRFGEAIAAYKGLIKLNSTDEEAFYNIGYCHMEQDSLLKAYQNFSIATELNPQYGNAFYMRGYVSELAANYEDAKLNYAQANRLLSGNAEVMDALKRVNAKTE